MTLEQSIHRQRLHILAAADASGNITTTCAGHGMSRTLSYRWRKDLQQYGPDGVRPKTGQARRGRPTVLAPEHERRLLALAVAWPTWGPARLSRDVVVRSCEWGGPLMLDTVIRENVHIAEAPSSHQPITVYAPSSSGADGYRAGARELLARAKRSRR